MMNNIDVKQWIIDGSQVTPELMKEFGESNSLNYLKYIPSSSKPPGFFQWCADWYHYWKQSTNSSTTAEEEKK